MSSAYQAIITKLRGVDHNKWLFLMMFVAASIFIFLALVTDYQGYEVKQAALLGTILPVSSTAVIGINPTFRGNLKSSYTLIEFGDYQCPPCRLINKELPAIIKKDNLRFEFRNLPLAQIHPFALQAAVLANEAKTQGSFFWPMHDLLYSGDDLDEAKIKEGVTLLTQHGYALNAKAFKPAYSAVEADIKEAEILGLNSTPSFLLCLPDGKTIHLRSLNQIEYYVTQPH